MLVLPLTNVSGATQNLGMKKILTSTHLGVTIVINVNMNLLGKVV